jgi:hypothetical protein
MANVNDKGGYMVSGRWRGYSGKFRPGYGNRQWLWSLAERMEWDGRWPRRLWRWLLIRCDRKNGYFVEYD